MRKVAARKFPAPRTRGAAPSCASSMRPLRRIVRHFPMGDGARRPLRSASPCCNLPTSTGRSRSCISFPVWTRKAFERRPMAEPIGWLAMSHGPQLMVPPERWDVLHNRHDALPVRPELTGETLADKSAKWQRCQAAIDHLRRKLAAWAPDVLVVVADDQHENIQDDANPPFTVYVGENFEASVSLSYFKEPKSANRTAYKTDPTLAQALLEHLMETGFDPAYSRLLRYEGGLGHAFARVLKFLTPDAGVPVVPIMVNTYFPPAPSARRCVAFGQALAAAIRQAAGNAQVA